MRRLSCLVALASLALVVVPRAGAADGLKADGRAGVVTALQGTALVRPIGRERFTPLTSRSVVFPGDVVRTEKRGAHALELRLATGARVVIGPGASIEFPDAGGLRLLRGDLEVNAAGAPPLHVTGSGGYASDVAATAWLRATDRETKPLDAAPRWLTGYRASTSEEWMGSLLATVNGKNVPLTVGYHKVVVEIRDQIARTTVEESFANSTDGTLEGVFSFPLPADASISGFGMWIGDELVEADIVEKQRAREIYEDILRRKKDPGLLEWEGGNLFKARVFPIFPHSEKRIRIRYAQVLPVEGDAYRYRYALRSELLRANPLRELSMAVSVVSTDPIRDVASPTHPVTVRRTEHEAVVEFGAQEYAPDRDFELAVTVGRAPPVSAIANRRGEDGFFLLRLAPPTPSDSEAKGPARDLVPEGRPVDLLLVADTSGSMDGAARDAQAQFLAALLAQLSPKDTFRLVACDVEPRWIVDTPRAVTPEAVDAAMRDLDARFSLGWSDLDAAFDAALAKAGPGTHVVYVGDGIPTAGKIDAVATADRIRTRGKASGATCHAVSTASSYEEVVLRAVASIGGGSVRRGDEAPASAARALLDEVARPGWKDLKVEVVGLPTARVYPETLPNLPAGEQQIVLGRFLPDSGAKRAEVVVTGTYAGKPVRHTASLDVPPPEGGNSFLPRLWARRHLDALLLGARSPETKEEIVEFSSEYQIMTPYTSFLVLENDEDRARYGVERGVKMRDAERFFAAARDRAALEIARRQAETARRWRVGVRRQMLREIEALGRDLPIPVAQAWLETDGRSLSGAVTGGGNGWGATRDEAKSRSAFAAPRGAAPPGLRAPMDPSPPASSPPPATATEADAAAPASADWEGDGNESLDAGDDADLPAEESLEAEFALKKLADAKPRSGELRERLRRSNSRDGAGKQPYAGLDRLDGYDLGRYRPRPAPLDASAFGFPTLAAVPPLPTASADSADPAWDAAVIAALRALDRRPALAALAGGLRIRSREERLHPLRGEVVQRSRATALVSPRRWHRAADGSAGAPTADWCSETERGTAATGVGLGRRREAADTDRTRPFLPLDDRSLDDAVRALSASYRRAPTASREGDLLRLSFTSDADPGVELRLVIDVARAVLVEQVHRVDGAPTTTTRYGDFVRMAERWWATRVERLDDEGHVVGRQALAIEALDDASFEAAFRAATAANDGVVFLPAQEPALAEAKAAVRAGRGTFADHLVLALDHAGRLAWDEAWASYASAERRVSGTLGASWMRLALLAVSRKGTELLAHAKAMAARIAADASPYAAWRAAELDRRTGGLGPAERLALLDALAPALDGRGPDGDLRALAARRRHADARMQAGDGPAARLERAAIAKDHPFDASAVLAHASDFASDEDLAHAVADLAGRAREKGVWTEAEAQQLFGTLTQWLWQRRDLPGLEGAADAWVATAPRTSNAHHLRLVVAYLRGRGVETDRRVVELLGADVASRTDPAARAAQDAAVRIALGDGWLFHAQAIPVEFRAPLAALALRCLRSDARHVGPETAILRHWRFRQTEEARQVRVDILADLLADGALAATPMQRLARVVSQVSWGSDEVPEDAARRVTQGLLARWRAQRAAPDEAALAQLLRVVLDGRGALDEKIAFLRERLATAVDSDAGAPAQELFDALLAAPHDAAREDEAFALASRLLALRAPPATAKADETSKPDDDDEPDDEPADAEDAEGAATARATWAADAHRAQAATFAKRLEEYVYPARLAAAAAASASPAERAGWTRAQARAHLADAARRAHADTATRLHAASASARPVLRPWLEVERLAHAAESRRDPEGTERDARAALPAPATDDVSPVDRLLARRTTVVLAYVATRPTAPAGLSDRVEALLRERLAAVPTPGAGAARRALLDARYELFRLLVALDRAPALEAHLRAWVAAEGVERGEATWRVALAYLLAETNRVKEAAALLEAVEPVTDLAAHDFAALASWYLVLKEDGKRDVALDRRYEAMQEWELQQAVGAETNRISRAGPGVPAELDPEALRALRVLLRGTSNPAYAMQLARSLYRPTKDFRVLQSVADGALGHSAEAAYGYAQAAVAMVQEIHEEATCDAFGARLDALSPAAKTDADRRALDVLRVAVETRAMVVRKADPDHAARAYASLDRAFEGTWVAGERVLLARLLASMVAPPPEPVSARLLARLEELLAAATERLERLRISESLARALWTRGDRERATDRLDAALAALRAEGDGTLIPEARVAYDLLVDGWVELRRFRRAEARLTADLDAETRSERRERLRMRWFRLEVQASEKHGALSIGSGDDLFRAAAAEMERYLSDGAANQLAEAAKQHGALHRAHEAGAQYEAFVRDRLPAILARNPLETIGVMQGVLEDLRHLRGPLPPIAVTLDLLDRETPFAPRIGQAVWPHFAWSLARWRADAGRVGDLEPRLLATTLAHLEGDLVAQSWTQPALYHRRWNHFWGEHAADYAAVAARVAELHAARPKTALFVARYQREGLDLHAEAVGTLEMAVGAGKDTEEIRWTLAQWLVQDRRFAEALPVATRLLEERPDRLDVRVLASEALHGLGRDADAGRLLEETAARWKERKAWDMNVASTLAVAALEATRARLAADWMDDALRLRREAGYGAGPDATLSSWYGTLARARALLGETDAAVDAASAAIVAWGPRNDQRQQALAALATVIREAKDFDAWLVRYEARVAASGLDAPVLRKAIAATFEARGAFAEAARQFRAARDLDPSDAEAQGGLVRMLDRAGDAAGALDALLVSLRSAPKVLAAYPDLARRFAQAGDAASAERARTNAVEAMPNEPDGHRMLAGLREEAKAWPAAADQWDEVARVRPLEPEGFLRGANARLEAGDGAAARAALDHLLSTTWDARFGDVKAQAARLLQRVK